MSILGKQKSNQTLTPLELEIMQVLWETGPSTVADVVPRLRAELAYTTVQTMLGVLLRKGKVMRTQEGKAFRYRPTVSREHASGNALEDLLRRMFGGSPEALLMSMVEARQISARELERLAARIAARDADHTADAGSSKQATGRRSKGGK